MPINCLAEMLIPTVACVEHKLGIPLDVEIMQGSSQLPACRLQQLKERLRLRAIMFISKLHSISPLHCQSIPQNCRLHRL